MTQLPGPASERELPRVPVPELDATCARFLAWCAPLLDAGELAATRASVTEFLDPDSPAWALQDELAAYDLRPDTASWLDKFWRRRYLGRRDRIALNANFFFLFPPSPLSQAERAAELVLAAVDYKLAIDAGGLDLPMLRGAPLSIEQNKYLFSATRIPGVPIDTSRTPYTANWPGPSQERHVVVMRRGRMYRLDVIDDDGAPYPTDLLASALAELLAEDLPPEQHAVGHLTTMARAEWARARDDLLALGNGAFLDTIETALFCLCLDDLDPSDNLAACDQLLADTTGNRWYDKALSFVVLADGSAGFNGEHCNLDGTTAVSLIESMLDPDKRERIGRHETSTAARPQLVAIAPVLDDALRATIARAAAQFRGFVDDTASAVVYLDVGAGAAKSRRASPDGVVQMAIQLAHYRARGRIGATYESIAMRAYRHGRTEAMRVVTPQSVQFVETMENPTADDSARETSLRAALDAHARRARECQAGDAPEQHLWELQLIAERHGETPALYDSPGWRVMRADYLSTSSVPSPWLDTFGFGSTSATCIGVGYVLLDDSLRVYLSTPRPELAGMQRFAAALRSALPELLALLDLSAPGFGG